MSWHTIYRPRAIADLHLQSVRETLQQFLKSGKLPQVFLFSGPKGTGKTSTARIIGALVNAPENESSIVQCFFTKKTPKYMPILDLTEVKVTPLLESIHAGTSFVVQEMDAASNRGIDDVRALKERVFLPPQEGSMTVYILDEAHMLTTEAFNALLKLLEEPPAHTIFILATTELHKIPATIVSRATHIQFHKASVEEIAAALQKIIEAEKLTVAPKIVADIATMADGSFRDAVKVLEQLAQQGLVIDESSSAVLGLVPESLIASLLEAVVAKHEQAVVEVLAAVRETGCNPQYFIQRLLSFLHQDMTSAIAKRPAQFDPKVSIYLLAQLHSVTESATSAIPLLSLEIALLDIVFKAKRPGDNSTSSSGSGVKPKAKKITTVPSQPVTSIIAHAIEHETKQDLVTEEAGAAPQFDQVDANVVAPVVDAGPLLAVWDAFIASVSKRNSTLGAVLESAQPLPDQSNGVAKVAVFYQFHQDQLRQPRFMQLLEECAIELVGLRPKFDFVVSSVPAAPATSQPDEQGLAALASEVLM